MGFTKLDEGILQSSVMAADPVTFKVWIALLAACESNGVAPVAPTFLAAVCHLPIEDVRRALAELSGPDPDSRTIGQDGRRIERVDGGWRLINYLKYRSLGLRAAESEARTERRHRVQDVRTMSGHSPDPSASASASASEVGEGSGERDDDRAERRIRESKVGDERKLLGLVSQLEAVDPKHRDAAELMRLVTSYDKDGRRINGCVNPATLSFERVRKSIEDAEAMLGEWRAVKHGA